MEKKKKKSKRYFDGSENKIESSAVEVGVPHGYDLQVTNKIEKKKEYGVRDEEPVTFDLSQLNQKVKLKKKHEVK